MRWNTIAKISALAAITLLPLSVTAQYYDNNNNYYDNNNNYDDRYDTGDYSEFYDQLAPHGNWMQDPEYGYVWRPNVGNDFRPYYTNGRWAMTDQGNMWVSNYSWGSIPFHYGRWVQNQFYGWMWIPGRQWAPAWVVWRQGGGHYGWAPMGPSISINFNFNSYYTNHYDYWTFIPCGNIYGGNYHSYRYRGFNNGWFNRTTIINNYNTYNNNRFFAGPRRDDVRRHIGRDVPTYRINRTNTRGRNSINNNSINVYAPEVRNTRNGQRSQPRNFSKIDNDKRIQYEYGRQDRNNQRDNINRDRGNTNDRRNINNDRNSNRGQNLNAPDRTQPVNRDRNTDRPVNNNNRNNIRNDRDRSPVNQSPNRNNQTTPVNRNVDRPVNNNRDRSPVNQSPNRNNQTAPVNRNQDRTNRQSTPPTDNSNNRQNNRTNSINNSQPRSNPSRVNTNRNETPRSRPEVQQPSRPSNNNVNRNQNINRGGTAPSMRDTPRGNNNRSQPNAPSRSTSPSRGGR